MAENSPSRIPTPVSSLRRSASVRVRGERPLIVYSTSATPFPSISEREEANNLVRTPSALTRRNLGGRSRSVCGLNGRDDDLDSVESFATNISGLSRISNHSSCEHSLFAKNGTTYSAKTHKYIVHCGSGHCSSPEEYLTPTQRANRNVSRLKTLLQLAKEKLVEKEREIFKLTKEVVELKVFKASVKNGFSEASTPSDCKEVSDAVAGPATYTVDEVKEFSCDSPGKVSCYFEEKIDEDADKLSPREKLSPTSPFHNYQRDKFSATPDFLLSSLADSGHFDDLASSLSLQSKDSLNVHVPSDDRPDSVMGSDDSPEKRALLVTMYESLLNNCKETQESELRTIKLAHEENNMKMVDSFEMKLKEGEQEFEKKFKDLLQATEKEKIEIVERFERKLEEERLQYMAKVSYEKKDIGAQSDMFNSDSYMQRVEDEKAAYEKSLAEIKKNFELEREKIEKTFDETMASERAKFELATGQIQADYEHQIDVIAKKTTSTEKQYNELLEKYQDCLLKISQLEEENLRLKGNLEDKDNRQKELYLKMFMKGQEAVKFQNDEGTSGSGEQIAPSARSVPTPELLVQLKVTEIELENLKDKEYRAQHCDGRGISLISAKEALSLWMLAARKAMYKRLSEAQQKTVEPPHLAESAQHSQHTQDPEATLQFLKSAVYYFLTDRDNHLEHLRAIESILGFTQTERRDIQAHYVPRTY